jgi:hypothetical protein
MRRGRRRNFQVRAHLIKFALADPFDCQQIFDAPEASTLLAEVHVCLGRLGADAGNLLQFLNIRDVHVQRMRRRLLLLRGHGERTDDEKNCDNCGLFQCSHRRYAFTPSEPDWLSCIRR